MDKRFLDVRANMLPVTAGSTQHAALHRRSRRPADPELELALGQRTALGAVRPTRDTPPRTTLQPAGNGLPRHVLVLQRNRAWPAPPGDRHYGAALIGDSYVRQRDSDGMWAWQEALIGESSAGPTDKVYTLEDGIFRRVVGFERLGQLTELVDYASGEGSTLRFGDGEFGMVPTEHSKFTLRYRLGNGGRTNIAADTLVVFPDGVPPGVDPVVGVNNPLAGVGGRDPESVEQIRVNAPQAFRAVTYRAVQPADYTQIAERLPWVQKAGAAVRWTGSWSTGFVTPATDLAR